MRLELNKFLCQYFDTSCNAGYLDKKRKLKEKIYSKTMTLVNVQKKVLTLDTNFA